MTTALTNEEIRELLTSTLHGDLPKATLQRVFQSLRELRDWRIDFGGDARPTSSRKRVLIESPFAGDRERNKAYLRAAIKDSLARGEAPFASHAFYTLFLDDNVPEERALGIECGLAWGAAADLTATYVDFGVSNGMLQGLSDAERAHRPVEQRELEPAVVNEIEQAANARASSGEAHGAVYGLFAGFDIDLERVWLKLEQRLNTAVKLPEHAAILGAEPRAETVTHGQRLAELLYCYSQRGVATYGVITLGGPYGRHGLTAKEYGELVAYQTHLQGIQFCCPGIMARVDKYIREIWNTRGVDPSKVEEGYEPDED